MPAQRRLPLGPTAHRGIMKSFAAAPHAGRARSGGVIRDAEGLPAVDPSNVVPGTPSVVPVDDSPEEAAEADRSELIAAIAMVANGWAVRVVLTGLRAPEAAAATLVITAANDGVGLDLQPAADGNVAIVARRL